MTCNFEKVTKLHQRLITIHLGQRLHVCRVRSLLPFFNSPFGSHYGMAQRLLVYHDLSQPWHSFRNTRYEWVTNVGSREESPGWFATSGRNSPTFQLRALGGTLHLLTLFGNANHREYKPINGARAFALSIAVESVYDLHGDCDTFVPSNTGVTCITYRLLPDCRAPQSTFVFLNFLRCTNVLWETPLYETILKEHSVSLF